MASAYTNDGRNDRTIVECLGKLIPTDVGYIKID